MPRLSPPAEVALLARVLHRDGYDDHLAGHITYQQPDGTFLTNPLELAWDELRPEDIATLDADGRKIAGCWNVTPAIGRKLELQLLWPDHTVAVHTHTTWAPARASAHPTPPISKQSPLVLAEKLHPSS